jgi:acetate kinase
VDQYRNIFRLFKSQNCEKIRIFRVVIANLNIPEIVTMNVLVLNCGSSSIKFQIVQTDIDVIEKSADRRLAIGVIERVGSQALITFQAGGQPKVKQALPLRDHRTALDFILRWIVSPDSKIEGITSLADIHAVGHRVVHGAEQFAKSTLITDMVIEQIEDCIDLAPLHNPANLKGIEAARELLGRGVPQVAVFDTAFHSTMPETSFLYAIPYQLYRRHRIRRYGFHGTSHRYVAYRYRQIMGLQREEVNIITLHLGNGCSACAIKNGDSIDTSMGMTPLEGLVMGTRGGDLDPSIIEFIHHKEGMSVPEIDTMLNKQSGLLGLSGLTNDMRELLDEEREHQDRRARLAIDIFTLRARKYIGAYLAELGGCDAMVFTGGIGENSPAIRSRICQGLEWLGLKLDEEKNNEAHGGKEGKISTADSRLQTYVIPTNEELLIARDTVRTVRNVPRRW